MVFNPNLPADNSKLRLSAAYIRNNWLAIQNALGPDLTVFPKGTRLWFYQDTAPNGWTTISSIGDSLLAIKGKDGSTYATGGNVVGSWQLPEHTLTIDEMPSHRHHMDRWSGNYGVKKGNDFDVVRTSGQDSLDTGYVGNNQPHNHGSDWRPQACVGIIAERS